MVDASEGILGIEWIDGQCVRKLLPGGEEPEEGQDGTQSEPDSEKNDEDPLKEYGVSIGEGQSSHLPSTC